MTTFIISIFFVILVTLIAILIFKNVEYNYLLELSFIYWTAKVIQEYDEDMDEFFITLNSLEYFYRFANSLKEIDLQLFKQYTYSQLQDRYFKFVKNFEKEYNKTDERD